MSLLESPSDRRRRTRRGRRQIQDAHTSYEFGRAMQRARRPAEEVAIVIAGLLVGKDGETIAGIERRVRELLGL